MRDRIFGYTIDSLILSLPTRTICNPTLPTSTSLEAYLQNFSGAKPLGDTDLEQYFFWESNQKGVNGDFQSDGSYCARQTEGTESVFNCYFPCPAS